MIILLVKTRINKKDEKGGLDHQLFQELSNASFPPVTQQMEGHHYRDQPCLFSFFLS